MCQFYFRNEYQLLFNIDVSQALLHTVVDKGKKGIWWVNRGYMEDVQSNSKFRKKGGGNKQRAGA